MVSALSCLALDRTFRRGKEMPIQAALDGLSIYNESFAAVSRRRISLMERASGIEPPSAAWEAAILPMNYARLCSAATMTRERLRHLSYHFCLWIARPFPQVIRYPVKGLQCSRVSLKKAL